MNEEAMAHWGAVMPKKKRRIIKKSMLDKHII